jgi:hypothetical protein
LPFGLLVAKVDGVEEVLEVRWVVPVVNDVGRGKVVQEDLVLSIVNVLKRFIGVTMDAMAVMVEMGVMVNRAG